MRTFFGVLIPVTSQLELDFDTNDSMGTSRIWQKPKSMQSFKPVLKWANVCSPEHTLDTLTNYELFLN